jgi:hypothetical protein
MGSGQRCLYAVYYFFFSASDCRYRRARGFVMGIFVRDILANFDLRVPSRSGVIGKSTKFGFEWKWPLMGKK